MDTLENSRSINRPDILTVSGNYFNFATIEDNKYGIYDIAVGLSNTCRFASQIEQFYSVAQHSILVSKIVKPEFALAGLLHDASEAFIHDISRPLKRLLPEYKQLEEKVERHIFKQYDIDFPLSDAVKEADLIALATEERDLGAHHNDIWDIIKDVKPLEQKIEPLLPLYARRAFIWRYSEIING